MSSILDEKWRNAILQNDVIALKNLFDEGYNPRKPIFLFNQIDGFTENKVYVPSMVFASVSDNRLSMLKTLHNYCKVDVINVHDKIGLASTHVAAEHGALEILKTLVGWGANQCADQCANQFTVSEHYKWSIAHVAAKYGQTSVLQWLFETDLKFLRMTKMSEGHTPASFAVLHKQRDALKVCFDFGYDVNEHLTIRDGDESGKMTLLGLAALQGNDKMVKWLRKNGARVTPHTVEMATLHATSTNKNCEGKQEFDDTKNMTKLEQPPFANKENSSTEAAVKIVQLLRLDLAVGQGHDKMAKWLRKNGARVTTKTVEIAASRATYPKKNCEGKQEVVDKKVMAKIELPILQKKKTLQQKLLSKLCSYCGDSKPGVPLLHCSACHMVTYCNKLCQKSHWKGHKPLCKAYQRGETVRWPDKCLALRLTNAIVDEDLDQVKHLIKIERFNLEDPVNKWMGESFKPCTLTALQYAVCCKRKSFLHVKRVIDLLVELGASLETKVPENGYTALFVAQDMNDIKMMKHLRYLGADINARDKVGRTILHVVSAYTDSKKDKEIAQMIASWDGLDLNVKDISGCTALELAKENHNKKMVKFLKNLSFSRVKKAPNG
eukprot:CAMPEP_0194395190 /NCGR_PEP_ID=MMETSP0174-20130528/124281_1 /TAXON_ID=216777 /ORGANISM="Proboscia alata, Strain PI-D3" /LENGTH=607 /DNA_ID=CAMNT_0039191089 /DNA_START=103 /DNA_END=1925 /DNA_ORIENTATION=-